MSVEVKVGDSALVVVSQGYRSYECYDVNIESVTKSGQLAVTYNVYGGGLITRRFYRRKNRTGYDLLGASTGYNAQEISLHFGNDAIMERARVLEWRKKQSIWNSLNSGLAAMPERRAREIPSDKEIADLRVNVAVIIDALNKAERWNHDEAKRKAEAELDALAGADSV